MRSLPGWSFSRAIALDGVGPEEVVFHAVWVSDRDATYFGHGVDAVDVGGCQRSGPVREKLLVGDPAHDERVVVAQLLDGIRRGLGVEAGPPFESFDDAVQRD